MGWLSGWAKRRQITIDHTKINNDLSDFPVLLYLSANSGINDADVTSIFDEIGSNKQKIAVTTSDGVTQCYVEIEKWDTANEKAWLWVKVPNISATEDTILYIYYDNSHSNNTTYVGTLTSAVAQNVWDSNFKIVLHLNENNLQDSTQNNNDGTNNGTTDLASSKIAGGRRCPNYEAVSVRYGSTEVRNNFTIEGWVRIFGDVQKDGGSVFGRFRNGYSARSNISYVDWGFLYTKVTTGVWRVRFNMGGSSYSFDSTVNPPSNEWVHVTITRSGATGKLYLNGSLDNEKTDLPTGLLNNQYELKLGGEVGSSLERPECDFDEFRISNTVRSDAWIKATYETERDNLLTWGDEQTGATYTKDYPVDVILKKLGLKNYEIDILLKKLDISKTYDLDVLLKKLGLTKSYSIDALLKKLDLTEDYSIDILLKRLNISEDYLIDVMLKKLGLTRSYSIDALLKKLDISLDYSLDVLVVSAELKNYLIDVLLKKLGLSKNYSIDTLIKKLGIKEEYFIDVMLKKLNLTKDYSIDVLLEKTGLIEVTFDVLLKRLNVIKSYSLDILLKKLGLSKSYSVDIILQKLGLSSYYVDILLKKLNISKSYSLDVLLKRLGLTTSYSIDVMLVKFFQKYYLVDVLLKKLDLISEYMIDVILLKEIIEGNIYRIKKYLLNLISNSSPSLQPQNYHVLPNWRIYSWEAKRAPLVTVKITAGRQRKLSYGNRITHKKFGEYVTYHFTLFIFAKTRKEAQNLADDIMTYLLENGYNETVGILDIRNLEYIESEPEYGVYGLKRIILEGDIIAEFNLKE
ncbi:MAG: DUF2341 domain-containing protein [Candidatus Helarchaeota archaeon]